MDGLELVTELVFMLACDEPDYDVAERRAKKLIDKYGPPDIFSLPENAWYIEEPLKDWCFEADLLSEVDLEENGSLNLEEGDCLDHVIGLFLSSRKNAMK